MRIGLQTWGSEGDLRPFIALAQGLRAAQHDVEVLFTGVVPVDTLSLDRQSGIPVTLVDSPGVRGASEVDAMLADWGAAQSAQAHAEILKHRLITPLEPAMTDAAVELAKRCDVLIGHALLHPLRCAAEKFGKPEISVTLVNNWFPSTWKDSGLLGAAARALEEQRIRQDLNRHFLHFLNECRARFRLSAWRDVVTEAWSSRFLNLIAVSPSLCRDAVDERNPVCGFMRMQSDAQQLDAALVSFLEAGDAPVFVTFGSHMPLTLEPLKKTIALLGEGTRQAACRVIVQVPGAHRSAFRDTERVHFVGPVAHPTLFPRCRAVIHHGGAGTTQAVCAAGVPSVVVPHVGDQFFWANQLHRAGLSALPIPRHGLRISALQASLAEVLSSDDMCQRAAALGKRFATEDGVSRAIALITRRMNKHRGIPAGETFAPNV